VVVDTSPDWTNTSVVVKGSSTGFKNVLEARIAPVMSTILIVRSPAAVSEICPKVDNVGGGMFAGSPRVVGPRAAQSQNNKHR
jgi:hypothetical protein